MIENKNFSFQAGFAKSRTRWSRKKVACSGAEIADAGIIVGNIKRFVLHGHRVNRNSRSPLKPGQTSQNISRETHRMKADNWPPINWPESFIYHPGGLQGLATIFRWGFIARASRKRG